MVVMLTAACIVFPVTMNAQSQISHEIELAKRYIVLEKYDDAKNILEPLYLEDPSNSELQKALKDLYFATQDYDKLLPLIENQLPQQPQNANLRIELGKIYLGLGKTNEAFSAFKKAISLYPQNAAYYNKIYTEYLSRGYTKEAREIISLARKNMDSPNAMSMEMATTYEIDGNFSSAMKEYSKYLQQHPDQFYKVERRINIAGRDSSEIESLEKAIRKMLKSDILGKDRVYRLLATVEQRLGKNNDALQNTILAETNNHSIRQGSLVYPIVERLITMGEYSVALKGIDYLKQTKDFGAVGKLTEAEVMLAMGKWQTAEEILSSLISEKNLSVENSARLELARIKLRYLNDSKAAEKLIEPILKGSRNSSELAPAVRLDYSIAIQENDIEKARTLLSTYQKRLPNYPWLIFAQGELLFFQGKYDEAKKAFHNLVRSSASDSIANEGLAYLLVLSHKQDEKLLSQIAGAMMFRRAGRFPDAIKSFEHLAETSGEMRPQAFWWLALTFGDMDSTDRMKQTLDKLVNTAPQSFFAPLAYERLGDIEIKRGDTQKAVELYTRVLNDYPDAINIDTVREKLRRRLPNP